MTIEAPPTPRLIAARERIADALVGSGLRVAYGGRFAAPCVLLEPAEPWIERATASRNLRTRWRVTAIAGRTDTEAAYDELAAMIDATDAALLSLRGASLPSWGAPHDVTLGNVAHPAAVGTIELHSEV
jgi:hypothetical protein